MLRGQNVSLLKRAMLIEDGRMIMSLYGVIFLKILLLRVKVCSFTHFKVSEIVTILSY